MEEEQNMPGSALMNGEDPVTASVDGFIDHETDPVTSVTGNEAESEDPVTSVTGNEAESKNPVTSVTNEKPDTKVIRVTVSDLKRIVSSGHEGEKPATVLHRLLGEMDALQTEVVELRRNANPRSGADTAIIPGQQSFSLKDAVDSLKDVCDDDTVRLKFAAKMIETQAAATNRRLDREHSAEQKRLDREDKEKDRDLKKELAGSRAEHEQKMTMIKKGMVDKGDLDNIIFLGQKNKTPAERIRNKRELAARVAANEEEELGDVDPPEGAAGGDPDYE